VTTFTSFAVPQPRTHLPAVKHPVDSAESNDREHLRELKQSQQLRVRFNGEW